jgi:uncharacterized peroxidase-related enzyme
LVVAAANRNAYCITKHNQALRTLGVPDRQLKQIIVDYRHADLSQPDMALLGFAVRLARNAPWLSEEDIGALRGHGFNDESILEAILTTALSGFLCTLSAGLGHRPISSRRLCEASLRLPRRAHAHTLAESPDRTCTLWK